MEVFGIKIITLYAEVFFDGFGKELRLIYVSLGVWQRDAMPDNRADRLV